MRLSSFPVRHSPSTKAVPGTEEFKESLDRALRSLDSYRRVVEQDTWRQHHLEGISSVQMAMQHVGAVAEVRCIFISLPRCLLQVIFLHTLHKTTTKRNRP